MKILLIFYAIALVFKYIWNVFASLFRTIFRRKKKADTLSTSASRDWYGICENCGIKGGLHRFEGKRYCAKCHARFKTEKQFGVKIDPKW